MKACPSWLDPELAHIEAVAGLEARERGLRGAWSHPAVYWAAIEIGSYDLKRLSYPEIRLRWEAALRRVFTADQISVVPEPPAPVRIEDDDPWEWLYASKKVVDMEEFQTMLTAIPAWAERGLPEREWIEIPNNEIVDEKIVDDRISRLDP